MEENKIFLNESQFTNLVKNGFIKYNNIELTFDKSNIKTLCKGEILEKTYPDWSGNIIFKIALQDIEFDMINEILKRSPIFSDLSGNFLN